MGFQFLESEEPNMKSSNYFPFGFRYPKGLAHNEYNPDPAIEEVKRRMAYLNRIHAMTNLPGHIFAAAMALFQSESDAKPDWFWKEIRAKLTTREVATIAEALADKVQDEPPRLEFPNAIALFDCRFVSTKEWEHIRRYSIGGSEAAAVLGVAKFQSQRTLYHEKKTPYKEIRNIDSQHILDYGHAVEPYVIGEIASRLGAKQRPEYRMFAHKMYPFITCNPDGILEFPDGSLALFEAKTAMWLKITDWKAGIPEYYAPQPRQYMEVLNDSRLNKGFIGVCLGGLPKDMIAHSYERDTEAGAKQVTQVVKYWKKYIERSVLPPFSGNPKLDHAAQYEYIPQNAPLWINPTSALPADTVPSFERYFELQAESKLLTKEINDTKSKEAALMQQIRSAVPEGMTICQIPDGMAYCIKATTGRKNTVKLGEIQNRAWSDAEDLQNMAEILKGTDCYWTTPKVSKRAYVSTT